MYNNILITSESGWDTKTLSDTIDHIFHEQLKLSDTYSKIKEFVVIQKKKQEEKYILRREENKLLRAKRKLEKKNKKKEDDSETSETETQFNKNFNLITKQLSNLKKFDYIEEKNKEKGKIIDDSSDKFELNDINLYIRDKKPDTILRNILVNIGYTIVQFRSDWEKKGDSAGIERNNTIFNLQKAPDLIIVFTKWKNDKDGIDHIITTGYHREIPIILVDNDEMVLKSFRTISGIETQLIPYTHDKEEYIEENDYNPPNFTTEKINNGTDKKMRNQELVRRSTKLVSYQELLTKHS
jgi:hypothetical protein